MRGSNDTQDTDTGTALSHPFIQFSVSKLGVRKQSPLAMAAHRRLLVRSIASTVRSEATVRGVLVVKLSAEKVGERAN